MIDDYYVEETIDGKVYRIDTRSSRYGLLPNSSFNTKDPSELIDFPCSDDFLAHYNKLGMTPRKPLQKSTTSEENKLMLDISASLHSLSLIAEVMENKPMHNKGWGEVGNGSGGRGIIRRGGGGVNIIKKEVVDDRPF